MRVMVVRPGPRYSVADVHNGLVKGLKANGVTVYDYRFDEVLELYSAVRMKRGRRYLPAFDEAGAQHLAGEHLQAACYRFWPDVIVFMSCFWIPPEVYGILTMRPQQHTVAWFTESPYEDDRQAHIAQYVDTVIVNDPVSVDTMRKVNPRSWYIGHAYDPELHKPGVGRDDWRCDVAFSGTGFPSRVQFLKDVDWSGINLRLGGMWVELKGDPLAGRLVHEIDTCLDNDETVTLYNSARAGFNLYRRETTDGGHCEGVAMGPREVEMAASELFFLRDSRPEGDEVLPMLPTFGEADDFTDKLRWWLAHDAERNEAARSARAAIADRTFEANAARLLMLTESRSTTAA